MNVFPLKGLTPFLILGVVLSVFQPTSEVQAWDCKATHPVINELAGKLFVVKSQGNAFGEKYKWAPVEFRSLFDGVTFSKGFWSEKASKKFDTKGTFIEWLARGGHDADIPELLMGFRHFYDPVYEPRYLTWLSRWVKKPDKSDFKSEEEFRAAYDYRADDFNPNKESGERKRDLGLTPHFMDPKIDGITWVLSHPGNTYSWETGLKAYKAAMENDLTKSGGLSKSQLFGNAFRALGETMHLLADMTQPAHVRADSHSVYEPLEKTLDEKLVRKIIGEEWKKASFAPTRDFQINAGLSPLELMTQTAAFTNKRFFSNDTISDYVMWVFPRNHKRPYPSPQLSELREENGIYSASFQDVGWVPLAKQTGANHSIVLAKKKKDLDAPVDEKTAKRFNVLPQMTEPQARVLMPVAIFVCAELIDRFFPTLELSLQAEKIEQDRYRLSGSLSHLIAQDKAWQSIGEIRYSGTAYLLVDETQKIACTFVAGKMTPQVMVLRPGSRIRLVVEEGARLMRSKLLEL